MKSKNPEYDIYSLPLNRFDPEYLPEFEEKVFFEGEKGNQNIVNFAVLLALATIISTFGILSDSVAAVIGAMIVAPLMTPIVALAASITMGNAERAKNALVLVIMGILIVIFLSSFLSLAVPNVLISFITNSQLATRISPNLFDLGIALAAGAAGAYALGREEISNSIPGVAIAISLVPPLSVVGISLETGSYIEAGGSFLLFLTNFFAILLAGIFIFTLMGLKSRLGPDISTNGQKRVIQAVFLGTIIVFSILAVTSYSAYQVTSDTVVVRNALKEWTYSTQFQIDGVQMNGSVVEITLLGDGEPPALGNLAVLLEKKLNRPVSITLHVILQRDIVYSAGIP